MPTTPSFATTDPELAAALERLDAGHRSPTEDRSRLRAEPVAGRARSSRSRTRSPGACVGSVWRVRSRTTSSSPRTTCSTRPMCGWRFSRVCSTPTAVRSPSRGGRAGSSSRRSRIDCATTSSSWSSRSAVSYTDARGRPKDASRGGRVVATVHHRSDAHILDIRLPAGHRSVPARAQGREVRRDRRRPADAVHRPHRARGH